MLFQRRLYCLCLILLVTTVTPQQQGEWEGCFNRELPNKVRIGEPTRVCLQVANGVNWAAGVNYVRASFEPVADDYSYYHIPNTYKDLISTAGTLFTRKNITVGAASQKSLSFLRMYYDADKQRVYPYLTAIMDVHKGVIRGITWDDACVFCGGLGNACEENTYSFVGVQQTPETSGQKTKSCYIEKEECDTFLADNPQSRACDLQLYTVWTGTDVDGKALQSQAFRFSEFPVQKSKDRLTQLIPGFLRNYVDNSAPAENTTEAVTDL